MKIIFFGTPDFAISSLQALNESSNDIVAVVTIPDKKSGRGLKIKKSPIKKIAESISCKILQPTSFNDESFLSTLKNLVPDIFIVVAFKKLPDNVISIPKHGAINLHASLLPKYRGAAPIYHALLNNEKETGVTTFFINNKIDAGMILLQEKCKILPDMNSGVLHEKLSIKGSELIEKTIKKIKNNTITAMKQNDSLSSKAPMINKSDQIINWNDTSTYIHNQIRALSPYPGAFSFLENKRIKIFSSKINIKSQKNNMLPGQILINNSNFYVGTKNGLIEINEIQIEGKNKLPIEKFIMGQRHISGMKFGQSRH